MSEKTEIIIHPDSYSDDCTQICIYESENHQHKEGTMLVDVSVFSSSEGYSCAYLSIEETEKLIALLQKVVDDNK